MFSREDRGYLEAARTKQYHTKREESNREIFLRIIYSLTRNNSIESEISVREIPWNTRIDTEVGE